MADKPSLAVVIAESKKRPGADPAKDDSVEAAPGAASPECVSCVRKFFEEGADGDYEAAATALLAAMRHGDSGEEIVEKE